MTTIADVAQRAGVSTATVSRVLSRPELVAPETRLRVRAAVDLLGYEPNGMARSLRTARASRILLTVPIISNPVFSDVIRGAERAAREAGYAVILGETRDNPEQADAYWAMMRGHEIDGIVFASAGLPPALAALIADGRGRAPVVAVCEFDPGYGVSGVHVDDEGAAHGVISRFIELGHRRIGVIAGPDTPTSHARLAGARRAMAERGMAGALHVGTGDYTIERGFAAAGDLIDDGVTAIFCFSDEMAIGALARVRDRRLDCPGAISIVGFDDIRFCRYPTPALATVAQPAIDMGVAAVELLLDRIAGTRSGIEVRTLPWRLIERGSMGPAPA